MVFEVINDNKDFSRAYSKGKACGSGVCLAYYRKNGTGRKRLGISTPKKVGNAVERSRARRIIRAAYTAFYDSFPSGFDIVVCAREHTPHCKSTDIGRFFEKKLIPAMNTNGVKGSGKKLSGDTTGKKSGQGKGKDN